MKNIERYDFKRFCKEGDYITKQKKEVYALVKTATGAFVVLSIPKAAFAAEVAVTGGGGAEMTWKRIEQTIYDIADVACLIALIITGAMYMFGGERGQIMNRIIQACAGYLLIRKAYVIVEWLGGI